MKAYTFSRFRRFRIILPKLRASCSRVFRRTGENGGWDSHASRSYLLYLLVREPHA